MRRTAPLGLPRGHAGQERKSFVHIAPTAAVRMPMKMVRNQFMRKEQFEKFVV
jgi:hypothetical protein